MAEVVWRTRAARQLGEIFQYIRERSPSAAERYATGLKLACQSLGEFPEKAQRYDSRYRALVFRNHFIFYRFERDSDKVFITAIIDARRDVSAIMQNLGDSEK